MNSMNILPQARTLLLAGIACLSMPVSVFAAGAEFALEPANNDVSDVASLQRAARNFVNYCMGCHTAKFVRYNKLQEDLKLSEDQVIDNLMFAARKTDELMTIAMPGDDAARWFGQTPPDLTLVSRSRGTDWIYTFLKTFYIDDRAATGTNNLVLPNASMPHVLWELQGLQEATFASTVNKNGDVVNNFGNPAEFQEFELVQAGSMSPEEYEQFVVDLVNFLDWAGTPEQLERQTLGIWVILFLLVLLAFSYLLKVEIWKDIK